MLLREPRAADAERLFVCTSDPEVTRVLAFNPRSTMADLAFFYGTLMTGFDRRRRTGIEAKMRFRARGWVQAALFDLGIYPAAVPAQDARVWGEVFDLLDPDDVLPALDEIEGYRPGDPDSSLYIRSLAPVHLPDGTSPPAWVYFYNAPLGKAPRIESGDYLEYLKVR